MDLKRYMQVPFAEKGRDVSGWDCWGVAVVLYKDFLDIDLPLYVEDYVSTRQKDVLGTLITDQLRQMWTPVLDPDVFDIISIRLRNRPMHIGVYLGKRKFIHALGDVGTVIERTNSIAWQNRIMGYYRYAA